MKLHPHPIHMPLGPSIPLPGSFAKLASIDLGPVTLTRYEVLGVGPFVGLRWDHVSAVPEPGAAWMLLLGLVVVALRRA